MLLICVSYDRIRDCSELLPDKSTKINNKQSLQLVSEENGGITDQ